MMNPENLLAKLISRARQEACPRVDVTGPVMATIYSSQAALNPGLDALVWVAVASFAVAAPLAVFAFTGSQTWVDPLMAALVDLPGWLI